MFIVLYVIVFLALWVVLGGLMEAGRSVRYGDYDGAISEAKTIAWTSAVLLAIATAVWIWKHHSPMAWIPACVAGVIALGFIAYCLIVIWQCRRGEQAARTNMECGGW
ncbi:MAG: hypothetical protein V1907_02665 [Candidatus Kerfeldbacteria bacterium]